MWRLYLKLKPALEDRERESILFDEAKKLLLLSQEGTLLECLNILYDNKDIRKIEPSNEYILLFINGLIYNLFFEFVDFVEVLAK